MTDRGGAENAASAGDTAGTAFRIRPSADLPSMAFKPQMSPGSRVQTLTRDDRWKDRSQGSHNRKEQCAIRVRGSAIDGKFSSAARAFAIGMRRSASPEFPLNSFCTRSAISFRRAARNSRTIPPGFSAIAKFAGFAASGFSGTAETDRPKAPVPRRSAAFARRTSATVPPNYKMPGIGGRMAPACREIPPGDRAIRPAGA